MCKPFLIASVVEMGTGVLEGQKSTTKSLTRRCFGPTFETTYPEHKWRKSLSILLECYRQSVIAYIFRSATFS